MKRASDDNSLIHMNASNLKGWARGVYHGLRRKHLQAYSIVFRFNRRKTRHASARSSGYFNVADGQGRLFPFRFDAMAIQLNSSVQYMRNLLTCRQRTKHHAPVSTTRPLT